MRRPRTIDEAIEKSKKKRPQILEKAVPYYETEFSVYPERVRVCFDDGSTEVYMHERKDPHPLIVENIRIIRKWKQEYVNQPTRRRRIK